MLTLLAGTNRPGSSTRKVVRHLEGVYSALGAPFQVLDLQDLPPEAFAPATYAEKPASLKPLTDKVLNASGLVVVTPEYNGGFPGVLKYFIDLLPFPVSFERRPVCFVGVAAGMFGALRPVEQLQTIFGYRGGFLFADRVFLPNCTKAFAPDGSLTDAATVGRLAAQAAGFVKFVEALAQVRAAEAKA